MKRRMRNWIAISGLFTLLPHCLPSFGDAQHRLFVHNKRSASILVRVNESQAGNPIPADGRNLVYGGSGLTTKLSNVIGSIYITDLSNTPILTLQGQEIDNRSKVTHETKDFVEFEIIVE